MPVADGDSRGIAEAMIRFVVPGKLISMKNRKIQTRRGFTFKNPEVVAYEKTFPLFVPQEARLRLGSVVEPLSATVTVFYPSRRSDLDCALIYDCLQASGVVANDRYIIEKHEFARVDPVNPRVEIELRKVEL